MSENKKQHYVPRFFFKNFSADGITIGVYDLDKRAYYRGPFKTLCAEDYFYSKDTTIEQHLGSIESKAAPIIRALINQPTPNLSIPDQMHLAMFILLQHSRTLQQKELVKERTRQLSKDVLKPLVADKMKKSGEDPGVLDDFDIEMKNDHIRGMFYSALCGPLISDLTPVLLRNETATDFIFSDIPVIFHNSYFGHLKDFGVRGIQSVGLQIYVPFSRRVGLLLYDPKCYCGPDEQIVSVSNIDDINSLNALQILYAPNQIFFDDDRNRESISKLHSKLQPHLKRVSPEARFILPVQHPDGTSSEIYHTFTSGPEYDLTLSFLNKRPGVTLDPPARHPELIARHKAELDKMMKESRDRQSKKQREG